MHPRTPIRRRDLLAAGGLSWFGLTLPELLAAGAGADGRDHWPNCFTSVLAGGGVPGGQVYGSSDAHAAYPDSYPTRPVDLMATVHHLLGLPPHMTLDDAQGRPHVVVPGDMINGIL